MDCCWKKQRGSFFSFLRTRPEIKEGVIGARDADFVATSRYQDFNVRCEGAGAGYLERQ